MVKNELPKIKNKVKNVAKWNQHHTILMLYMHWISLNTCMYTVRIYDNSRLSSQAESASWENMHRAMGDLEAEGMLKTKDIKSVKNGIFFSQFHMYFPLHFCNENFVLITVYSVSRDQSAHHWNPQNLRWNLGLKAARFTCNKCLVPECVPSTFILGRIPECCEQWCFGEAQKSKQWEHNCQVIIKTLLINLESLIRDNWCPETSLLSTTALFMN